MPSDDAPVKCLKCGGLSIDRTRPLIGQVICACTTVSTGYTVYRATKPHDLMKPTGVNAPMKKG